MPLYTPDWRPQQSGYVWVHADLLRQILDWLTNIEFANGEGAVSINPTGILLSLANGVYAVQLTGDADSDGYYEGSVYANGTGQAATHTGQQIKMPFDVDITDPQGYYWAIRSNTSADLSASAVWIVVGGIPKPAGDKIEYLRNTYGVLSWVEKTSC